MELEQQLAEVVATNMDSVQMDVVKREMTRYRDMEMKFLQLQKDHERLVLIHGNLKREFSNNKTQFDRVALREEAIKTKEAEMREKETKLHIETQLITLKLANAELRVKDARDTIHTVFRGPVFQKSVVENRSHQVVTPAVYADNYKQMPDTTFVTDSNTTDTTIKEE